MSLFLSQMDQGAKRMYNDSKHPHAKVSYWVTYTAPLEEFPKNRFDYNWPPVITKDASYKSVPF